MNCWLDTKHFAFEVTSSNWWIIITVTIVTIDRVLVNRNRNWCHRTKQVTYSIFRKIIIIFIRQFEIVIWFTSCINSFIILIILFNVNNRIIIPEKMVNF